MGQPEPAAGEQADLAWWWSLLRACCFVVSGIAFMVMFVCIASEGDDGETEEVNRRQERVCLAVAAPLMIGFGGAGLLLDRAARRRRE
jgi:hypothetical protein